MTTASDAVLVLAFNRPEYLGRLIERLREVRPPRVYLAVDGPRPNRPGESRKVQACRDLAGSLDWGCEVRTLFQEHNLGCGRGVSTALGWFFEQEERIVERYLVRSPDDFSRRPHVVSSEGAALVRQLAELGEPAAGGAAGRAAGLGRENDFPRGACEPLGEAPSVTAAAATRDVSADIPARAECGDRAGRTDAAGAGGGESDDADMVVIEEDLLAAPTGQPAVAAVRLGDYRRLFARLRRGG